MKVLRHLTRHRIACVNWPETYPARPEVDFSIAHDGNNIFLEFEVSEEWSRAVEPPDGRVWEDSCVEMFLSPDQEDGIYYNLECNCAGSFILRAGRGREGRQTPPADVFSLVKVFSTVAPERFEKKHIPYWKVALVIPKEAFALHDIKTLDGAHFKGNFYKCGDALPEAHFLSYAPITAPKPDFHRPEFFIDLDFESSEV